MCVAKGGRGCFKLSYGQLKFTPFSKKKQAFLSRWKKSHSHNYQNWALKRKSPLATCQTMAKSDLSLEAQIQKLWEWDFLQRLIFLLTDRILSHSPNFGRPKQGQTFVVPTFHIHFLNPECVRIPWVLAPKNFPIENFRVRSDLQKSSIFHWFLLPPPKKKYRARVPTILMPPTFPIARLNRYTPNFSGVPQKLT